MHIRNRRGQRTRSQKSCTHTSRRNRCYTQCPLSSSPFLSPHSLSFSLLLLLFFPCKFRLATAITGLHTSLARTAWKYLLHTRTQYQLPSKPTVPPSLSLIHCLSSSLSPRLSGVSIGVAYIYFNCPLRVRLLEVINSVQVQLEFEFEFVFDCWLWHPLM